MITKDSIETAYCFFHQKERIYAHSTMAWQRDDIEYAIASYADEMNSELYEALGDGRGDFLRNHATFHSDLSHAIEKLEEMRFPNRSATLCDDSQAVKTMKNTAEVCHAAGGAKPPKSWLLHKG